MRDQLKAIWREGGKAFQVCCVVIGVAILYNLARWLLT